MEIIKSPNMPKSSGHYSQCIKHNDLLYISGQLPKDRFDGSMPSTIEEQTDLVLNNIEVILNEAGSSKNNVIQVRIYIPNVSLWDAVNERYSLFFGDHKPVRCVVPSRELHSDSLVEIELTACVNP